MKPLKDLFIPESKCNFFCFIPLRLGDKCEVWEFETGPFKASFRKASDGILCQEVTFLGLSEKVTTFPYGRLRENIK